MTLSPYKKYIVVPRKYQLRVFVKRKDRARLGTLEMAMTSLKLIICTAVTIMITYMWPANMLPKKIPIITNVQIARVMKVCFFFSNSEI